MAYNDYATNILSRRPMHVMEHLITFRVKNNVSAYEINEKLQTLVELTKRGEIWPLKIFLTFTNQRIIIYDENKVEVDNFPASRIIDPRAFIDSASLINEYNNILVFSIPETSMQTSEMHFFQVKDISAAILADELRTLNREDALRRTRALVPKSSQDVHDLALAAAEVAAEKKNHDKMQITLDIQVMNNCFEDIEYFANHLHCINEILQEINEHQNGYGNGTGNLLFTQHRSPTVYDFHDIFAKQKHAFNFVAKLQAHLPDATETTRQLLQTLRKFVDSCKVIHNGVDVVQNVKDPLLPQSTLRLIRSCLRHKDDEDFWASLGVNWNRAQEWFRNYHSEYKPIFYNQVTPEWLKSDDCSHLSNSNQMMNNNNEMQNGNSFRNSTQFNRRDVWLANVVARNGTIAEVINNTEPKNERELQVFKGEFVEVINNTRKWWKVCNFNGNIGFVPYTVLTLCNFDPEDLPIQSTAHNMNMNNGRQDDNRNYQKQAQENGYNQQQSYLSQQFKAHPLVRRDSIKRSYSVPVPPPMPPTPCNDRKPPPPPPNPVIKTPEIKKTEKPNDDKADCVSLASVTTVNEELEFILKQRQQRKDLEILKTPQIYISAESTPAEVLEWLRGKGFSDKIVQKLGKMNGSMLFSLSAHTIEGYFGQKESRRLISQIVLQKNFCEYKTIRSTELSTKLARARQKVDQKQDNVCEMNATAC